MSGRPRVGVVGAGAVGREIAGAFARTGAAVAIYDPDPDRLSVVPYRIALELDAIAADPAAADNVVPVASLAAVATAELIFEAAPEEPALKRMLCATLGMRAPSAAILATATTTLSVAEIAAASPRPDRFLGLHWPPPGAEPVELIAAEMTDPAVVDRLVELLTVAGQTVTRPAGALAGARAIRGKPRTRSEAQSLGWMTNAAPARQSGVSSTSAKRQPSAVRTQRQS
jgi:3-hydroxyacyl-CoA dehydrogenase